MPRLRHLYLALLAVFVTSVACAHDPFQNTIELQVTADGLEVVALLSPLTAGAMLTPPAGDPITREAYTAQKDALHASAARVCVLLGPDGQVIPSTGTHVSLNPQGELQFLFEYPAATRPASLRVDLLSSLGSTYFFEVIDRTSRPPRLLVLMHNRSTCQLATPPAVAAPAP